MVEHYHFPQYVKASKYIMSTTMAKPKLLPRMRTKTMKSGKVYYYYDTCVKPRKWLPMGGNYLDALRLYAEFEKEYNSDKLEKQIKEATTFKLVADRYLKEVVPTKAPASQKCNLNSYSQLMKFFDNPPAPLDSIKPKHIRDYLNFRSESPIRANRERALFSHIFNKAREWGYTDRANPVQGVRGHKESGRDVYVTDALFWRVYDEAAVHVQNAMMVAYLIGQRVSDVLKIKVTDINDGYIWVKQNKTQSKLRIQIVGQLETMVNHLLTVRIENNVTHDYLIDNNGSPTTYNSLRYGMDKARAKAGVPKADFQFRDLRAKAATDRDDDSGLDDAKNLLGHKSTNMTTEYVRHRLGKRVKPSNLDMTKHRKKDGKTGKM